MKKIIVEHSILNVDYIVSIVPDFPDITITMSDNTEFRLDFCNVKSMSRIYKDILEFLDDDNSQTLRLYEI